MLRSLLLLLAIVCVTVFTVAAADKKPSQAELKKQFDDLVSRARTGDPSVDFKKMRFLCADLDDCEFGSDKEKDMMRAFAARDHKNAVEKAEKLLDRSFPDAHVHFVLFTGYKALGDNEKSEAHRRIVQSLMDSYTRDGDGLTPEKAIPVAVVHEEYIYLQLHGYAMMRQSADMVHKRDIMKVRDREGKETTIYFDASKPIDRLNEALK